MWPPGLYHATTLLDALSTASSLDGVLIQRVTPIVETAPRRAPGLFSLTLSMVEPHVDLCPSQHHALLWLAQGSIVFGDLGPHRALVARIVGRESKHSPERLLGPSLMEELIVQELPPR